jgi:hypothetical protein
VPRVQRMMQRYSTVAGARFDPNQHQLEAALRGRVGRRVRASMRRMEPVLLSVPRWSQPERFLEDLALDLAVGQPGIGCRTVDLSPLKGRRASEAWQFTLHLFSQLGRKAWRQGASSMVVHRGGFRFALGEMLEEAHRTAPHPVALLAHGAQHLPVEIVADLRSVWNDYWNSHPEGTRCTLLLATAVGTDAVGIDGMTPVSLVDYGADEAATRLGHVRTSVVPSRLAEAVVFTGGIPGLVDAVGQLGGRDLPAEDDALLYSLGPLVDEIRGAVDIVNMDSALSDRLHSLIHGQPVPEAPSVDDPLRVAGLVRAFRSHGSRHVVIRAPAIATLLG